MPTEVQFRRGTTAQNDSFTGAAGELSVNIDNNSVRVHDGSTVGGFELAKADLSNTTGLGTVSAANIGIGTTIVISAGFELQNIQSLDATTTATIESAVAAAPNNFTSLDISGIGTVGSTFNVGTGGTVLSAQPGTSSVGIASAIPTATLDVFGTGKISDTLTVGSATTIAANSLKVGQTIEVTDAAFKFAGVEVLNTTGVYFPTGIVTAQTFVGSLTGVASSATTLEPTSSVNTTGIITASRFSGELVGAAVTTVGGLHQNTGIATIAQVVGNLTGSVNSGFTTVTDTLRVSGITTLSGPTAIAGVSTFHNTIKVLDGVKALFGNGGDLEIYHDGSNSFIADVGGGSLQLNATPDIRFLNNSTGIGTIGAGGLDIAGGITLGATGITTVPEIKIGAAVTAGAYGINISGGIHIAGVSTLPQIVVGAAVTAASSGLDALNVNVGTALTVVGISTFSGLVNVGVDTSVGIVMTASNGTRYRLIVEDDGSLSTVALA